MTDEEKKAQEQSRNFWRLPDDPKAKKEAPPWPVTVMYRLKKIHELLIQMAVAVWLLVIVAVLFAIRW